MVVYFFFGCKIIADSGAIGTVRASRSVILRAQHFFHCKQCDASRPSKSDRVCPFCRRSQKACCVLKNVTMHLYCLLQMMSSTATCHSDNDHVQHVVQSAISEVALAAVWYRPGFLMDVFGLGVSQILAHRYRTVCLETCVV